MSDSTGTPPPDGEESGHPHGQQRPPNYGQPAYGQPAFGGQYDQPGYGQQPGQAAYGPQYGQPYDGYGPPPRDPGKRPATVTAAGVVTLVLSGLTLALFGLGLLALAVARDDLVDQLRGEPALGDIDPNDIVSLMLVVFLVFAVWCIAAMVLAVFAMRRSNGARIGLVVSSSVVALLSLLGIQSVVSVVTLGAAIAAIVCLFAGGASQWYAGTDGDPGQPAPSGPIA